MDMNSPGITISDPEIDEEEEEVEVPLQRALVNVFRLKKTFSPNPTSRHRTDVEPDGR